MIEVEVEVKFHPAERRAMTFLQFWLVNIKAIRYYES